MILQVPRQKRIRTRWCPSSLAKSVYNSNFTMVYGRLVGGFNPSEKYEFVIWDCYSQYLKKNGPNHQPVDMIYIYLLWLINQLITAGAPPCINIPNGYWISKTSPLRIYRKIVSSFSCLCLKVGHPLIRSQNSLVTSTI